MKRNQFERAQETLKEIKEIEKQIGILENGYCNSITGWDYSKRKETGEHVGFSLDGDLREIVIHYKKQKLANLLNEFEKL